MTILDGVKVEDKVIDPAKHKFIGMFREPFAIGGADIWCECGEILRTLPAARYHWQMGHWDIPRYQTTKED